MGVSARMALSAIGDNNDGFQIRPAARAASDMLGDLFCERSDLGALIEPDLLLDGDTGSIGKLDAHASDCAAALTNEPHDGIVAGAQLWAPNHHHRVGHA